MSINVEFEIVEPFKNYFIQCIWYTLYFANEEDKGKRSAMNSRRNHHCFFFDSSASSTDKKNIL